MDKLIDENKVIRKRNPALRKTIQITTLNKVKSFLKEQISPVFKSEIVKSTGVDYNSLNLALTMIKHNIDDYGKIFVGEKDV